MFFRLLTPFLWFASFILLLLATLSAPIIPHIFLLSATADITGSVLGVQAGQASESVWFGVWGWCAGEASFTVLGDTHELVAAQCSARHLGYTLDPAVEEILQLTNSASDANLILKGVTTALVLHPIACGLAFLAWVLSFYLLLRPQGSSFSLCAVLPAAWLAGLLTTIAFVVDVVFVAVARSKVWNASSGTVSIGFGNAVWMVLGAMIAAWLALGGTCAGVCCGEHGWRARRAARNQAKF
ncbi:pali-domain-containing protein [Calocera viscosa TUFC12733]|uniref:Pali-domain-containing protein n=1 Tax=Calocera viscosa (strain TUFC12733) TaxID=1330018 RepID=A0A167NP45_CALVF|nr:pali-domain-containing protein [Calocera viscosa TUFC12733]